MLTKFRNGKYTTPVFDNNVLFQLFRPAVGNPLIFTLLILFLVKGIKNHIVKQITFFTNGASSSYTNLYTDDERLHEHFFS